MAGRYKIRYNNLTSFHSSPKQVQRQLDEYEISNDYDRAARIAEVLEVGTEGVLYTEKWDNGEQELHIELLPQRQLDLFGPNDVQFSDLASPSTT